MIGSKAVALPLPYRRKGALRGTHEGRRIEQGDRGSARGQALPQGGEPLGRPHEPDEASPVVLQPQGATSSGRPATLSALPATREAKASPAQASSGQPA